MTGSDKLTDGSTNGNHTDLARLERAVRLLPLMDRRSNVLDAILVRVLLLVHLVSTELLLIVSALVGEVRLVVVGRSHRSAPVVGVRGTGKARCNGVAGPGRLAGCDGLYGTATTSVGWRDAQYQAWDTGLGMLKDREEEAVAIDGRGNLYSRRAQLHVVAGRRPSDMTRLWFLASGSRLDL